MAAIQSPLVPPCLGNLARRYVTWRERKTKQSLMQLRLQRLSEWQGAVPPPEGLEIVSLRECGTEWLLRRVYNDCAAGAPGFRPARHIDMLAFSSSPLHDRNGVFLARAGSRYVGTAIGRVLRDGTVAVLSVSVHPDFRRQGLGRSLLHAALAYGQRRGAHAAMLYLDPENHAARQMYNREGFE